MVSGVLGGMASLELTGIGMCTFIPLTARVVVQPFLIAVLTVGLAFFLPITWKIPVGIYTVPMLIPTVISLLSFTEKDPETMRFLAAAGSLACCWIGCFVFGLHTPKIPEASVP